MRLTVQRTLFEIINFLLALFFVIPPGGLIEQLSGRPLFRCCFIPCLAVLGFILGRVSMTRSSSVAVTLCVVGFVVSTALAVILSLPLTLLSMIALPLITAFFSLFYFFSARKAGYTVYAPMAVAGILIHLVILLCCAGFEWGNRVTTFTSVIAILFFLLSLFAFSAKGLRRSMFRGTGSKREAYPAGMQMGNFLLVAGFVIVAAFISSIYPIFRVFSAGFSVVMQWLLAGFSFFISLFNRRSVPMNAEEDTAEVAASDNIMNVEPKGEAGWITKSIEIFAFFLALALIIYLLYKLAEHIRASGARLPGFLRRLKDRFAPVVDEDYEDETESLFDMKKMMSDTRQNMKNALKRIRERPQRIDDFPDIRMKVRFAFQQMLKKVKNRNPNAGSQTPNEIYNKEYSGEEDFREFIDYYNMAKYSDEEMPEDAERRAREILKQKL